MKNSIIIFGVLFTSFNSFAQGGVSVNNSGTPPNPNAMLDVASDDKGVLITRLTTAARTTLGGALGMGDNGMLVYDKDLLVFYYWDGMQWVLVGNGIGSDDQNLTGATLTGTTLQIDIEDGSSATVDLAPLQDGVNDADADITNEIQDLSLNTTTNILTITNNGTATSIDLTPYIDNTDAQDLSLIGDVLSLTGDGTTVDLAPLKDHDWYEVGGTTQADNITDEIYTQGKVGIGNPTPNGTLDVFNNNGRLVMGTGGETFIERNSGNTLTVRNTDNTSTSNLGHIILERGDGSGDYFSITTMSDLANGVDKIGLTFGTSINVAVNKTGEVGVGEVNPIAKLQILNQFAGQNVDTSVYSRYVPQSSLGITHFLASGASTLGASNNIGLHVDFTATNNNNEFGVYIDGESENYFSNNVGIGTVSPLEKLHVNGEVRNNGLVLFGINNAYKGVTDASHIYSSGTTGGSYPFTGGGNLILQSRRFDTRDMLFVTGASASERMVIKGTGDIGVNTVSPTSKLDVNGDLRVRTITAGAGSDEVLVVDPTGVVKKVAVLVPAGMVNAFAGTTAPTGYLICDGSAVSRTTYADLFAVVGITYGAGNGTTTFNLPDLRGEFIRGFDAGRGVDPGRVNGSNQKGTASVYDYATAQTFGLFKPTITSGEDFGADPYIVGDYPGVVVAAANADNIYAAGGNIPDVFGVVRPRNIAMNYCIKF